MTRGPRCHSNCIPLGNDCRQPDWLWVRVRKEAALLDAPTRKTWKTPASPSGILMFSVTSHDLCRATKSGF
jgi:hypothetical protein